MSTPPEPDRARILFVCTANRCRSPLAERLAARVPGADAFAFASAGLLPGGHPTPPRGIRVAAEWGVDLRSHRSRPLERAALETQDLVIAMERLHAREIVAAAPDLWPRVFTLRQLDRWLETRRRPAATTLSGWLDAEAFERSRLELVGVDADDDLPDPVRSSVRVWRETATELHDRLGRVLDRLS